jgi:hypothetical protein
MPAQKQIPGPENKSLVSRAIGGAFLKTARTAISTIKPGDWMSALQPLIPWLPMVFGRQYDFPIGKNINYIPRGDSKITFNQLRGFSQKSEVARMVIENQKDKLCSQPWQIKGKEGQEVDEEDPRIEKWTKFFKRPDGDTKWSDWYRMMAANTPPPGQPGNLITNGGNGNFVPLATDTLPSYVIEAKRQLMLLGK